MMGIRWLLALALLSVVRASEVVVLDTSNFEQLTQAASGSTTGDWLVKFYAPWCGHCKKMTPTWEKVAEELKGEVNVAKVDVTQNRDLGTRFDIQGFPTVKMISKGKEFTYKGRRTVDALVEFARGGFQIQEPTEVQPPMGLFGEIKYVYEAAYKKAIKDLKKKDFFTMDVFLTFLPALFVILMLLVICTPLNAPAPPPSRASRTQPAASGDSRSETAAPPTSATDSDHPKAE